MKRTFILLVWLVGILLPMAWFGRFSESYQHVFNFIFGPPWMHVVTHAVLFAVLAYLLAVIVSKLTGGQANGRVMVITLFLTLLIALLQEVIQLGYKGRPFGYAEVFDLGVDMAGVCLGLAFFWWRRKAQ
jgi:VanZ family protein